MASATFAPAPFRCAFVGLRVEIPDLDAAWAHPSPLPSPSPCAPPTSRPLGDWQDDAGPSAATLGRRTQVLGTRAGTPRRVRVVRFADAREPMPTCLAYQGLRSAALGSTCGTPRASAPVVHFLPSAARAHSLGPHQTPLECRRRTALGARGGSPRRGRALVSFASLPERACPESLARDAATAGPTGAPWECQSPWEQYMVALASAPGVSTRARKDLLGSRQGTPRRQKQLRRTSSDVLDWDILTL